MLAAPEPNILGGGPPPPDPSIVDMESTTPLSPKEFCATAPKGVGVLVPKGVEDPAFPAKGVEVPLEPNEDLNGVVAPPPPPNRPPVERFPMGEGWPNEAPAV